MKIYIKPRLRPIELSGDDHNIIPLVLTAIALCSLCFALLTTFIVWNVDMEGARCIAALAGIYVLSNSYIDKEKD